MFPLQFCGGILLVAHVFLPLAAAGFGPSSMLAAANEMFPTNSANLLPAFSVCLVSCFWGTKQVETQDRKIFYEILML